MKRFFQLFILSIVFTCVPIIKGICQKPGTLIPGFRAPAVPLVTHDPYFSIWSGADRLTDVETMHWTGRSHPLHSMIRIDGKTYRLMGSRPSNLEPLPQTKVDILPTRTVYYFENQQIHIELTFLSPVLATDMELFSRPVTYLQWKISSTDGRLHQVQLYMDAGGELVVNEPEQQITWDFPAVAGLSTIRMGSVDQPVLKKKGDDLRIDWGFAYLTTVGSKNTESGIGAREVMHRKFIKTGQLAVADNLVKPRAASNGWFVMSQAWDLGDVGTESVSRMAMLSYDDLQSIRYFSNDLKPWWRRYGMSMEQLLPLAAAEFDRLNNDCNKFDTELSADLEKAGGKKYAAVASLVYRQCVAAHKLVADPAGMPLLFSKENFSNGCIATVDVMYPASPFFLLFSPALTKAMLEPIMDYASSARWKFPFAPHDLGTYPHATGQVYGQGEEAEENQMPVEETGNMLIMTDVLARMEGNALFAKAHWPLLKKWASYLESKGFDPENQLCTDDFAGHLAHNVNLSAKAIEALASYAYLCNLLGEKGESIRVKALCQKFAGDWMVQARDGNHTRLAFDRPGTWSMKYNLVWDKVLDYNIFPEKVFQQEIEYYKKVQSAFGLPLDSRERYTKNDWITWTATMANSQQDFETLFNPVYDFACNTPQRVPLSDWYNTDNAYYVGFQARSVVGGFFMKMLDDENTWKKWFSRGDNIKGEWAPLKFPSVSTWIFQNGKDSPALWRYSLQKPQSGWQAYDYDDSGWTEGQSGFGSDYYPNARTPWETTDIWIRRSFTVDQLPEKPLVLSVQHDEDAEIYINGVLVAELPGYTPGYRFFEVKGNAKEILRTGKNTIAIHCTDTYGARFIDAGLGISNEQ